MLSASINRFFFFVTFIWKFVVTPFSFANNLFLRIQYEYKEICIFGLDFLIRPTGFDPYGNTPVFLLTKSGSSFFSQWAAK